MQGVLSICTQISHKCVVLYTNQICQVVYKIICICHNQILVMYVLYVVLYFRDLSRTQPQYFYRHFFNPVWSLMLFSFGIGQHNSLNLGHSTRIVLGLYKVCVL